MIEKLFVIIDDDLSQAKTIMGRLEEIYGETAEVVRIASDGERQDVSAVSDWVEDKTKRQDQYLPGGPTWDAFLRGLKATLDQGAGAKRALFVVVDSCLSQTDITSLSNELRSGFGWWTPKALIKTVKTVLAKHPAAQVILTSSYLGFTVDSIASRVEDLKQDDAVNKSLGRIGWVPVVMFLQSGYYDNQYLKRELEEPEKVFEYSAPRG